MISNFSLPQFTAYTTSKRSKTGNISKLMIEGEEEEDKKKIEKTLTDFYKALFNGHHRTVEGSLQPIDTGTPFQEDLTHLDEFLPDLTTLSEDQRRTI